MHLTAVMLPVYAAAEKPVKTGLLIFSTGSWMVFSNNNRQSYFNKTTTTAYGRLFSVKTMVSVPLDLTVQVRPEGSIQRFWPGDFDGYLAYKFGWIEPRLGLLCPLGYGIDDAWKKKAWIGSNNVRLQGGFSISKADFEHVGLPFGLEAMLWTAITDKNAHYIRGGVGGQLYIKSSLSLSKKVNIGGELAVYGKSITWKWNRERERSGTIMPTASGSYRINGKLYIGVKAGFGPSFRYAGGALHRRNYSCDAGASVQWYP
jgi:hypothetical protein